MTTVTICNDFGAQEYKICHCYHFPPTYLALPSRQTIKYHSNPTTNGKEAEVEWIYEDLQDLLELTPKADIFFITGERKGK